MPNIREYRLVTGAHATYNERRAAAFLREKIRVVTGLTLPLVSDTETPARCELIIGRTNREALYNVSFERSRERLWEYELRYVNEKLFLSGLGLPDTDTTKPYRAYDLIDDGAYGTVYAAYHFVDTVLGYEFVYAAYEQYPENKDIQIDGSCEFEFTRERLAAQLPAPLRGAGMWSVPTCTRLNWNMSCFILRTAKGRLIVLDGGFSADCEHILRVIKAIAGTEKPVISAWLLSHLHPDHFGVYKTICENKEYSSQITVENFYCRLLPEEFYTVLARDKFVTSKDALRTLTESGQSIGAKIHRVNTGDRITVDEMSFEVLHAPADRFEAGEININDSSVVYKLNYNNEQTVLFLSDAERYCSDDLLANHSAQLPSDVVQVGHHGCGNVSFECYSAINAKAYLWQVGERFWYGDDGEELNTHNVGVIRTRSYTKELGAKRENIYRDTDGILALGLPIEIK